MKIEKLRLIIKSRSMRLPRFFRIGKPRLPGLGGMNISGKNKQLITGAFGLSAVVLFLALFFGIYGITAAKEWPDAGAKYALGSEGGEVGINLVPYNLGTPQQEQNQTLMVTLAAGARISTLQFADMDLGKAGLVTCFQITRDASNTTGYLFVDNFTITGMSAPSLAMSNSEIAILTLAGNVDGHTNNSVLDNTISEQIVLSTRGSGNFAATGSTVDRVIISILGDATVGALDINNTKCSVGEVDLSWVKAGNLTQDSTSRFGDGDGIDLADYVINTTVKYRSSTDSLVDVPITVR